MSVCKPEAHLFSSHAYHFTNFLKELGQANPLVYHNQHSIQPIPYFIRSTGTHWSDFVLGDLPEPSHVIQLICRAPQKRWMNRWNPRTDITPRSISCLSYEQTTGLDGVLHRLFYDTRVGASVAVKGRNQLNAGFNMVNVNTHTHNTVHTPAIPDFIFQLTSKASLSWGECFASWLRYCMEEEPWVNFDHQPPLISFSLASKLWSVSTMHCEVKRNQFLLNYTALNSKPFLGGPGHQGELHPGNLIQ